ncbi:uncharacterized protein [Panulirus ornatus]|uniref:uncharacterized protein n=1 Tax=Panulirus ornatus TaxID=150431 RepID=UPI003A8B0545
MLKWLVTRGPTTNPPREVVTDDPLATLKVKGKANTPHQIYAVSRVNPIYHDEETEVREGEEGESQTTQVDQQKAGNLPESPPTDRSSVRSSGYGSKETDSASERSDAHEEEEILGAEVEAALRSTSSPSSRNGPNLTGPNTKGVVTGKVGGEGKGLQSVAQTMVSFEASANSGKDTPAVISIGGKPVATIVTQHPQFVRAIEVGIRRTRSLETFNQQHVAQDSGSSTVPRPIWPRVNSLDGNLQRQSRRNQVQESLASPGSENGQVPNPIDIVKQDLRYVTSIAVTPLRFLSRAKTSNPGYPREMPVSANTSSHLPTASLTRQLELRAGDVGDSSVARYFGGEQPISSYALMSLQPDSLVTEDTLRMMRYSKDDDLEEMDYESPIQVTQKEPSPPLPDFSQIVYTRGVFATLNRAASLSTKDIVKPSYKTRSRSLDISLPSQKACAKKRGLTTVTDLWEKSGLKTNGRKLVVNVNGLLSDRVENREDAALKTSEGSSVEQLRSFRSAMTTNERREARLESDTTNFTNRTSNTFEDFSSLDHKCSSHQSMDTKSSGSYGEVSDDAVIGIDNPAFLDDNGHPRSPSPPPAIQLNGKPILSANKFLDPDKLAEFQKKISEKLQGAPSHRMQWLDLDEIVVEDAADKHERRVKFTADTVNPGSLERRVSNAYQGNRRSPPPGRAFRAFQDDDVEALEGKLLQDVALEPSNLTANDTDYKGIWAISQSYRDRFQEAPPGTVGRGKRQKLWETYYGTAGTMDRTLPRHLAPHPNSQAPFCGPGACHDFTLDLRRSDKLRRRSVARQKRRRCYAIVIVFFALSVFLGVIVAVSLYYTKGEKFFGSM